MKIKYLKSEAKRQREKHPDISVSSLVKIATEDYGVSACIYTPLAWKQATFVRRPEDGKKFIFYYDYEDYTPLVLGHELGHAAAGHFDGYRPNMLNRELEADSFASQLFNLSLINFWKLSFKEAWKHAETIRKDPDKYRNPDPNEIEKLKRMGLYWLKDKL